MTHTERVPPRYEYMIDLCRIVETGDGSTGIHVDRVGEYSFRMARELGLAPEECDMILLAARIHDIGKIRVPDTILKKPGKLTREEFAVIKRHPVEGMKIIETCKNDPILIYARDIVLTHHEKYDGSGYPFGLKGKGIPLRGRIVAVADVFDAITSERVYKSAWPLEKALTYMKEQRERQFDPEVVDAFLSIIGGSVCLR